MDAVNPAVALTNVLPKQPGNEGGDKRIKRDDVDGLVPKLESPPMSTITTAASDNCGRKSKASAPPEKSDYIHVRARRGQATDSHSLAERVSSFFPQKIRAHTPCIPLLPG